jgi:hypothetical protein
LACAPAACALALLVAACVAAPAAAVAYTPEAEADRVTSMPGVAALPTTLFSG